MIGKTISHYLILDELGRGGMGVVYRAEDSKLERRVALKFLPPGLTSSPDAKKRFVNEARAASALDHPNVGTIHEIDETGDGRIFICMAYYAGGTVKEETERGPLEINRAIDLSLQIARGLDKAHDKGIVHRDVKPANILLTEDGQAKIVDFGLAKLAGQSRITKTGTTVGTAAYMSPEQARGEDVDRRTDIWSLGALVYEMLTGRVPFKGDYEPAVVYSILNEQPQPLTNLRPDAPPELAQIVEKALKKNRDERYQSAGEIINDLEALAAGPGAGLTRGRARSDEPAPSIAVLPFVNMSSDPENDYFGDGLAEELINALTRLKGVRVAARTSAFRFRGRETDIREIGGKLSVDTVLEGSVRKAGNRLRITAQLINVKDGYHLWSERYDRELEDIFAVQDEITTAIVERLEVELAPQSQRAPLVKRYTENLDAYVFFLKGRYYWNKLTPEGWDKSLEFYQKALTCDPDFAPAYVWTAIWYQSQAFWGNVPPRKLYRVAIEAANKALEIDETIADVHNFLAVVDFTHHWNWADAERKFKRSLELDPASAMAHLNYSLFLLTQKRYEEANAEAELARGLDPLSSIINSWAAITPSYTGKQQEAIERLKHVVTADPQYWQPYYHLGMAYLHISKPEEAIQQLDRATQLSGGASIARTLLICALYLAGKNVKAEEQYKILAAQEQESYVAPAFFTWINVARGNIDEACKWLLKAKDERDPWICWSRINPPALQANDPRFDGLLDGIGLP